MKLLGKFSFLGSEASLAEAGVWVPLELAPLLPGSYKPVIIFSKTYWLGFGKTTKVNQNI